MKTFKESLQKLTGFTPDDLPENFIERDYNLFE